MNEEKNDLREKLDALKKKAESAYRGAEIIGKKRVDSRVRGIPASLGGDIFNPVSEGERPLLSALRGPAGDLSGRIEELVQGKAYLFEGSTFFRVFSDAETIWKNAPQIHGEYLETLAGEPVTGAKCLESLRPLQEADPGDICYLDIETTGLSNTPLFLIGLMYSEGGRLMQDLLFARDYTEERAVLAFLARFLPRFSILVTFNGVRFDIPFIMERMASESIAFAVPGVHIDLLPVSRRLFGKRTPNHRLQTLESYILGRKRVGDIPGNRIPVAYHDYVRTGEAGLMAGVIHHNRLDLLSMLELVTVYISKSGRIVQD
ncbi:MAG: ribonuclease H-like domain-containing protein [Candidatus Krumholzibacteriota bacterium]|nr:ribonuclease H-like domain-containing protein [Candidatus Krumholzibacteriota bacterium]